MDQAVHQPKKRFKRLIEQDFVDNSSESDDESIRAEQDKVEKNNLKPWEEGKYMM